MYKSLRAMSALFERFILGLKQGVECILVYAYWYGWHPETLGQVPTFQFQGLG